MSETNWISVDDSMPSKSGKYIVTYRDNAADLTTMTVSYYDASTRTLLNSNTGYTAYANHIEVLVWMDCPTPYKSEEKQKYGPLFKTARIGLGCT